MVQNADNYHWLRILLVSAVYWNFWVNILTIILLFHSFTDNRNLLRNGACESEELSEYYGTDGNKNNAFLAFQVHKNTIKSLLWKEDIKKNVKQFPVKKVSKFFNVNVYQQGSLCLRYQVKKCFA